LHERWGIWFAVEGDLRFFSHHDMMRAAGRIAIRARLPLRYSQGFNPRPILSLVCPRPVGVASDDDLLVVTIETTMPRDQIVARLNQHAPSGMRFTRAGLVGGKTMPRPVRADYQLPLPPEQIPPTSSRLAELLPADAWPVERSTPAGKRRRRTVTRTVDLRPLVKEIAVRDGVLSWTQVPRGDRWARPGEVLALLGLEDRAHLARTVRTAVQYEPEPNEHEPSIPTT